MSKQEIGNTVLRVTLGLIFLIHGIVKFQGGIENTVGWFDMIGLPGFLAYIVAVIELVGGLALIFGIGTRITAGLIAVIMVGAIFTAKMQAGFLGDGTGAGYELDLALLAMAVYLVLAGTSKLSLDHKIANTQNT
ncbi:DoxX family protein [Salinicoccus roseus]|uniref:DoxX family protein n=1 Tax=Salinicoccus roseus TaxID=45670 RepID=A0A0C2HFD1_9STAP|nr:DoxX family protein [Salinicoccus roseus]KIH70349.1 oxidoreductase [Salinicoccus roseus]MDB0580891.1 DoxX family protein [Salinicoccus roseus]